MPKEREVVFSAPSYKQGKEVKRGKRVPYSPPTIPADTASVKTNEEYLDHLGREKPDPTPVAPPIGYKKQPSMVDHIRAMVRRELSEHAANQGLETFEEADDFEVGEDFDPSSPYEYDFDPPAAAGPAEGSPGGGAGGPPAEGAPGVAPSTSPPPSAEPTGTPPSPTAPKPAS